MPFALHATRPPGKRSATLLEREVDAAFAALSAHGAAGPTDQAVHEVRRRGKRSRALLRLLRGSPGGRGLEAGWRHVGRASSGFRDAHAIGTTLVGLLRGDRPLAQAEGRSAREHVAVFCAHQRKELTARLPALTTRLTRLRAHIARWRPECSWQDLVARLVDGYRRSRQAARSACGHRDHEARHAWRRRVKSFAIQMGLLRPLWPEAMLVWTREWDRLADTLGAEHDLHLLLAFLRALPTPRGTADLQRVVEQRLAHLRADADRLGRRVHAEKPRAFAARVDAYRRAIKLG